MPHTILHGNHLVDSGFVKSIGGLKGARIKSLGGGDFYVSTPIGPVEFYRDPGKKFPGSEGMVYLMESGDPDNKDSVNWLLKGLGPKAPKTEEPKGWLSGILRLASEQEVSSLVRLAKSLPKGSKERKAIIAAIVGNKGP
jgi:hypothetical protein